MQAIHITPQAVEEIKKIISTKNIPTEYGLRLIVEGGGGCGGARFRLGFDKRKENDAHYEIEGLSVLFEKKFMLFLIGTEIDYEERANEKGFVFNKKSE